MNNRFFIFPCLMLLLMFGLPFTGVAGPDPGCDPLDPACPIDGGVALLIAAGVGLGARKRLARKAK